MKNQGYQDEFLKRRANRQRQIRKRRLKIFFIFFIIIMLVAGVTLSLTVFFPIDSITAGGSKIYESSSIIEASGLSLGKNLFTFSNRELTENIRKTLPYIKTVTVKRKLPGSVSIKVTDAMEFACYKADDLYYTVGEDGFVLRQSDTQAENIMLVETNNVVECKPGSYIKFDKPTVEETVSGMISEFSQNGVSVDIINVEDELDIKAKVEGRFKVSFGSNNNMDKKIAHLAGMIKSIDTSKTGKIDLSMWTSKRTEGTFVEQDIG